MPSNLRKKSPFAAFQKQQETDPAYEFDTPVPPQRTRKEKEQQLELEASIGDLAPTAIA